MKIIRPNGRALCWYSIIEKGEAAALYSFVKRRVC